MIKSKKNKCSLKPSKFSLAFLFSQKLFTFLLFYGIIKLDKDKVIRKGEIENG
jgi:hypothetical protein